MLIQGAQAVVGPELVFADILCEDGRIAAVSDNLELDGAHLIDARGLVLGPGFIDIHCHGGGGNSFFTRDASRLATYSDWAPRHGVTAFLVSTSGRHPADIIRTLEGLAPAIGRSPGAESLGIHLEGPFLNPVRKGAFDAAALRQPASDEIERYVETAEGKLRAMTLAPELPGALELVAVLLRSGAVPALGHSDATFHQATAAFDAGATHTTHLFNAMRPLHQREGGIATAALLDGRVTCELICDGAHVSVEMLRLAWRLLGPQRMVAVTDNMYLAGTEQRHAEFLGGRVDVSGDAAIRADGTIVGSTMPMDGHFQTLVERVGLSLPEAFAICSTNPAAVAGAADRKGAIAPGFDADLVLLDASLSPAMTLCRGKIAYVRDEDASSTGSSPERNASNSS